MWHPERPGVLVLILSVRYKLPEGLVLSLSVMREPVSSARRTLGYR